jgi:hypothetical protein
MITRNWPPRLALPSVIVFFSLVGAVALRPACPQAPRESRPPGTDDRAASSHQAETLQVADDNLPIRDPGPIDTHAGPVHPHPITPQHVRIQQENALIGALNDAMNLSDGPRLHELLDRYRAEYPEDPSQLQLGYQVIADCLERPGAESRGAATRYYEKHRGSIVRRFVGRHCLDR